MFIGHVTFVPY